MTKKTLYGKDAREKILAGIRKITAAVKVTLGPLGRNVLISQGQVVDYGWQSFPVHVTKDGYTTARAFDLDDPFERPGVLMVKEAAQKTVNQAGDGTTTCCVLLEAIVEEGMKLIDAGANPMELRTTIAKDVEEVVAGLRKMAVQVAGDNEKLFQIATISANNDAAIGRLIADAFQKIGHEGMITVEEGKGVETEIKIAEGYRFDQSWISPYFINNPEKQIVEFENPLILLYNAVITHHIQFERALALTIAAGRPILIICPDAKEEGLETLVWNVIQKRIKCCVVHAPGFGDGRRQEMEDLAILTGGTYVANNRGVDIKEIEMENFGQAKKVTVTKEETVIIEGNSDRRALQNLLNELRMNLAQAKNEDEKAPIEKRIAKLIGGVAVIQVGAATETEMKEKMDRFDDAVRATKSAIAEGFVPGAGTTFLRLMKKRHAIDVEALREAGKDWEEEAQRLDDLAICKEGIIFKALKSPLLQIGLNAGIDAEAVCQEVLKAKGFLGFNAKTGKVEDLVLAGVIDPVKVLRCALQNAASAAAMVLTTECLICDSY